jgi:hypothetical protein
MFSFSLLIDPPSVDMLVGPPSASEVIGQGRSLTKLATTPSTQSFNCRVRDECLNINVFWSLAQARVVISRLEGGPRAAVVRDCLGLATNAPRLFRADRIRRPSVIEETFLPRPHALVTRVCPDARAAFGGESNARRHRSARPG